ncbi:MAG TPA: DUF262 domain-containing protein [Chitinophagaceae bacterium]|nr:DUF262 domain-containing protein [Chitinophagaceae bacterium]
MKASETKVEEFLSSNKTQFVIPVYQRNYDWTIPQCKQLLDDILEVGSKKINAHFIGSIVFVHDDVYTSSRVKELTIIDGQQRITTITLIYLALYHLAKELGNTSLENEINETYLINKYASEEEKLKLRPTENNDEALKYLLRNHNGEEFNGFSRLIDNFKYFRERIVEENFEVVLAGLSKLMFVEVSLDREKDNPQRIFESLNSTGLELTQADLIRNYILMGLKRKDQNKIYHNYWEVIERYAKDESSNKSRVSDFIRDYLTVENNKIPNKNKVYIEFKDKYPTSTVEDLESILNNIKTLAKHYNKLINPKNESDLEIRKQLEFINRLEINVAYPFLIRVYEDYSNEIIDKEIFIKILELIQTYTWRRFIVGLPTNALNKIFMNLYDKIDKSNYLYSIQKTLLQRIGTQRFPRNEEVVESLKIKDVYNIKSKNRTYLLERLENYQNNEPVRIEGNPDITIEHIFPQNPDVKWKLELGQEEFNEFKNQYLNTIGNLTLTGYNSKMSNKYFTEKRDMKDYGFKNSRLWLNKYISELNKWGISEVKERLKLISERFLKIWDIPNIDIEDNNSGEEINIFEADDPKGKKLEYAVFFDQKLEIKQVSKLYQEIIRQLFDLEPQKFFTSELAEKLSLTKTPSEGNPRQPVAINDSYFIESNFDNIGKFDRIKLALQEFDLEDELLIKYEE